jgi:hypothetical protein
MHKQQIDERTFHAPAYDGACFFAKVFSKYTDIINLPVSYNSEV